MHCVYILLHASGIKLHIYHISSIKQSGCLFSGYGCLLSIYSRPAFIPIYQTVLQLPPLMSFWPPPCHCYSVHFSLCRHSRCDYCHMNIVPCPRCLLETLRLFCIMWAYTRQRPTSNRGWKYMYGRVSCLLSITTEKMAHHTMTKQN